MKKTLILLMLVTFVISLFAADDLEMILSGNASTDHFVVKDNSSNTLFMVRGNGVVNIPTLSSAPSSPAEGDMYTNSTSHEMFYYDGSSWAALNGVAAETDPTLTDDGDVSIGDNSANPIKLTFDGTTDADIFYDATVSTLNFEIGSHNVLQTIHSSGIIDFHKQSRSRAYQVAPGAFLGGNGGQLIPVNAWTAVYYDALIYDQQLEFTTGSTAGSSFFTAIEAGYYQVNARLDFILYDIDQSATVHNPNYQGYVSVSIFVDQGAGFTLYAQGDKDQGADNDNSNWNDMQNNLGVNVSDVVQLMAGDRIEIRAWQSLYQTAGGNGIPLRVQEQNGQPDAPPGSSQIYVSIHKLS